MNSFWILIISVILPNGKIQIHDQIKFDDYEKCNYTANHKVIEDTYTKVFFPNEIKIYCVPDEESHGEK